MVASFLALVVALVFTSFVAGQQSYTLHGSVILSNGGEFTPAVGFPGYHQLTSVGAQQMFDLGSYFRNRYISANDFGGPRAPIQHISTTRINDDDTYVMTLDNPQYPAAAQAFMQGLYPPASMNVNGSSFTDPTAILANGSYFEGPLGGYKYPLIRTVASLDPQSVYLDGLTNCMSWAMEAGNYLNSQPASNLESSSHIMYSNIAQAFDQLMLRKGNSFSYYNARTIWQYISYQYVHNSTVKALFDAEPFTGYLANLRHYASLQEYYYSGNMSVAGANGRSLTSNEWVRPIAGRTVAAKILGLLNNTIASSGTETLLNLIVTDESAMVALFSLISLTSRNQNFIGLPEQGSAAVFELLSLGSSDEYFPKLSDLWVRFYFLNGTEEQTMQSYSIFSNGPSHQDMRWSEFVQQMEAIMIGSVSDWCEICGDASIFCPAFSQGNGLLPSSGSSSRSHGGMSLPVAGVIGAIVTLVVVGILMALAGLAGGIRLHRLRRGKNSEVGGFRGSQKLASDQDLVLPKGGAGATVVGAAAPEKGHERVGSWEMKNGESNRFGDMGKDIGVDGTGATSRPSFDADDLAVNPFGDPVKPDERV
ncbi:phosphoglycerate mutase-like protein [Eremomyces bilateralis CBS 781.70]|uniref:Phosphoglycerate mutase-like protein n=1 Tax=Eremomyces bilateralis CBS 781.70 TaxID=1392243 RepID=A0A6G1GHW8_9PEZI|nr:phosphoglycerate mutase-like protein [Eremomyces bilateralis CBS 781.70]KAF1817491.1 phosphoglycerate mutase-like protein [Eremomyces bilateralis CBS 781.70]